MNIIAIDPSINNTGYCVMNEQGYVTSGVIRTDRKVTDGEKLYDIVRNLRIVIGIEKVEAAYVETSMDFSYAKCSGRFGKSLNQAALHKLNRAIGAIMLVLAEWGIPVTEIPATQWKGRRNKKTDQLIARQISGKDCGTDEADAICLAEWARMRMKVQARKAWKI